VRLPTSGHFSRMVANRQIESTEYEKYQFGTCVAMRYGVWSFDASAIHQAPLESADEVQASLRNAWNDASQATASIRKTMAGRVYDE
jgi:hypothetical protein